MLFREFSEYCRARTLVAMRDNWTVGATGDGSTTRRVVQNRIRLEYVYRDAGLKQFVYMAMGFLLD